MADLQALRSIVGAEHAREAGEGDAVDGVTPVLVARPGSVEEVSRLLVRANEAGWRVTPRGGGTKLGWGAPPAGVDVLLDMGRFDRVVEHAAGDLVATFQAGADLDRAQEELARAGQMLALDPPQRGATVGGVIAANAYGPRRFRYGSVRDLLIGLTIVLPDGTVAKAGGKVVKNVAGYDLPKLMTGSLGTLGVIVQAIFRLHPRLPARRLVEAELVSAEAVGVAVQRLLHSTVVPSAIQLAWPDGGSPRVGVLFEGEEPGVVAQANAAVELLRPAAAIVRQGEGDEARWREMITLPPLDAGADVKISCLPADLGHTIDAIRGAAARRHVVAHLTGLLGNGLLHLRLDGSDPAAAAGVVRDVRGALRVGSAVLLDAAPEIKRQADVWGPVGDSLPLMRRVKEQFDPQSILNPGRFVGGI